MEDFLSPDVSLPLPSTLTSANPLFPVCSQTSSHSLSPPLGHLLSYSFVSGSQALTPDWETTLEEITSKVVNINLD